MGVELVKKISLKPKENKIYKENILNIRERGWKYE